MIDPNHFRKVLSAYPTGVSVIAAQDDDGKKHAMVVGTFTSISLDPPLVGFFPANTSSSWAAMQHCTRFSVNVLAAEQMAQCKQFATSGTDKFGDLAHGVSPNGQPLIDGAVAWLDCAMESVIEVGDHYLVVGRVEALDGDPDGDPMLFCGGKYQRLEGKADAPDKGTS